MQDTTVLYEERTIVYPGTRFLHKVLRFIQAIPQEGKIHTIKHFVTYLVVSAFLTFPVAFGPAGLIYQTLQDGYNTMMQKCVEMLLNALIYWMVLIILLWRSDKFNTFFCANESFRFGLPRTISTRGKLYRIWSICAWLSIDLMCIGGLVSYHVFNCPQEDNQRNLICEVGFPAWYPLKVQNIYFKTFLRISAVICVISMANVLTAYALIPESVMLISARIRHLESILTHTRFQKDVTTDVKKFVFCRRYHDEIKKLVLHLNDTMGYSLFPEFTVLILNLSTLEFRMVFDHDLMSFIAFLGWFLGAAVHCEMGHVISEEYEKLRWAVYGMNWYAMKPELRKTFLLLLGSVQRPINFLVPPLFCLNRECLLRVIKGSYTFLMYLNSLSDKK